MQQTMLQFLAVLDTMRQPNAPQQPAATTRPATVDQGQLTLQAAFAGTAASKPVQAAPVASPSASPIVIKAYDISDSAPLRGEAFVEQQLESMQIVGQCLGDKRKRHDVLAAEAEAVAER